MKTETQINNGRRTLDAKPAPISCDPSEDQLTRTLAQLSAILVEHRARTGTGQPHRSFADEEKKFEEKLRRRRLRILEKQLQEPMRPTTVINLIGKHIKPYDVSVREDLEIIVRKQWIYIGREVPWCGLGESDWHNPFKLSLKHKHTPEQLAELTWKYEHEHLASRPDLLERLPMLKGQVLCCWCAPEPCHGDVLARLADAS